MFTIKKLSGLVLFGLLVIPLKDMYRQAGKIAPVKEIHIIHPGDLYVWPNPVNNVLHVRTPFHEGSIEIIDASGCLLQKMPITPFITNVPVLSLKSGIYFVRIKYDINKQAVVRFVKA